MERGKRMRILGKVMIVLFVCILLGSAVSASAVVIMGAAPYPYCAGVAGVGAVQVYSAVPVYASVPVAIPFGYVTTSVAVVPVTTAITYAPYVATAYPVVYPGPVVLPRIVTVPTYAVIR
jgi:hypothetical protein